MRDAAKDNREGHPRLPPSWKCLPLNFPLVGGWQFTARTVWMLLSVFEHKASVNCIIFNLELGVGILASWRGLFESGCFLSPFLTPLRPLRNHQMSQFLWKNKFQLSSDIARETNKKMWNFVAFEMLHLLHFHEFRSTLCDKTWNHTYSWPRKQCSKVIKTMISPSYLTKKSGNSQNLRFYWKSEIDFPRQS